MIRETSLQDFEYYKSKVKHYLQLFGVLEHPFDFDIRNISNTDVCYPEENDTVVFVFPKEVNTNIYGKSFSLYIEQRAYYNALQVLFMSTFICLKDNDYIHTKKLNESIYKLQNVYMGE